MLVDFVTLSEESQFCQLMNTFVYVGPRRRRRHFIIASKLDIQAAWATNSSCKVSCLYERTQAVLSQMRHRLWWQPPPFGQQTSD